MAIAPAQPTPPSAATMATLLDQLRKHLESELAVHKRLLTLSEQLGAKLLVNDPVGVQEIVLAEDEPTREAARLRCVRDRLVRALAAVFQLPGEVTLSELLPRATETLRSELERLRRELTAICQRLGRQSERNLAVARQAISMIREVMGSALGTVPSVAYDRRGLVGMPVSNRGRVLNIRG